MGAGIYRTCEGEVKLLVLMVFVCAGAGGCVNAEVNRLRAEHELDAAKIDELRAYIAHDCCCKEQR